jgi:hypothetical protein
MNSTCSCFASELAIPAGWLLLAPGVLAVPLTVEFNRKIRPLLSDKCFAYHGPDKESREGGLRLDVRE